MTLNILAWLILNWPWVAVGWFSLGIALIFWPNSWVAQGYLEEHPQLWIALPIAVIGWPFFLIASLIAVMNHDPGGN